MSENHESAPPEASQSVSEKGYDGEEPVVNFTSMKHCIKRILKASKIQLDDFKWKNGVY